ncbi:MAG: hypothetical protein UY21_C0009G0037 [Microgenomates group bacterium GW2011_GWA1_48_10]|nr:MAG: hypothetical protein UY21_C0009G0037 [Microgenomates group bacterium GW2011_GWA1_48_10]
MKSGIHPQYYDNVQVVCACGHVLTTGSTKQSIKVELCANCHPFYTGTQKFVDSVGKVQKFQNKQAAAAKSQAQVKQKKQTKQEEDHRPKTLREMLQQSR